ncbi:hypothetical protein M758_8G136900 [Ceratodon purpureus]|nr:hypothetical protein M758_8G136900 [Ceratodon purpureus]
MRRQHWLPTLSIRHTNSGVCKEENFSSSERLPSQPPSPKLEIFHKPNAHSNQAPSLTLSHSLSLSPPLTLFSQNRWRNERKHLLLKNLLQGCEKKSIAHKQSTQISHTLYPMSPQSPLD